MVPWKIIPVVVVILIPLCYLLYYFGIGFTSKACFGLFHADLSLPTRWEGKFQDVSGCLRRNFVTFKKYSTLLVEIETTSGALDLEVTAPDGSALSPSSGVYGRDAHVTFDVSNLRRCRVTLRMDRFSGQFRIALLM